MEYHQRNRMGSHRMLHADQTALTDPTRRLSQERKYDADYDQEDVFGRNKTNRIWNENFPGKRLPIGGRIKLRPGRLGTRLIELHKIASAEWHQLQNGTNYKLQLK